MSHNKSITLIELLITLIILSIIGLFIGNIEVMVRRDIIMAEQQTKLTNDASYILEHMKKQLTTAIGDFNNPPLPVAPYTLLGMFRIIRVRRDTNSNGIFDSSDHECAYMHYTRDYDLPIFGIIRRSVYYCDNADFFIGIPFCLSGLEPVSLYKIHTFDPTWNSNNNYIDVSITACQDPDGSPYACGTSRNPAVTMQSRIYMPSVSTH